MSDRNLEYNGTFSSHGVLFEETLRVSKLLAGENVEERLVQEVHENKLFQINSEETRGRVVREIKKKNKWATEGFWQQFNDSPEQEKRLLYFFLCLRTYRILFDLHFKVTLKQYRIDSTLPDNFFYKMAIDELASENAVIAGWSEKTLVKTFGNYRTLLRTAGLLEGTRLRKPDVHPEFWVQFRESNDSWFMEACFQ